MQAELHTPLTTSSLVSRLWDFLPPSLQSFIKTHEELIKFATVGLTTMVVDIIVFYSLTLSVMSHHPSMAKIMAGAVAMCVSYLLNSAWVFKNRGGRRRHHEIILFFAISIIGIAIGATPEYVATHITRLRPETGPLMTQIVTDFILSYIVGNVAQMLFRFWALRKFAYPEDGTLLHMENIEYPEHIEPSPDISHLKQPSPVQQPEKSAAVGRGQWNFLRRKQAIRR